MKHKTNQSPAETAREFLTKREIGPEVTVEDYPCSDNCGPGPRFIMRAPNKIPICMNLGNLYRARRNLHGQELIDFLFN